MIFRNWYVDDDGSIRVEPDDGRSQIERQRIYHAGLAMFEKQARDARQEAPQTAQAAPGRAILK